MFFETYDDVQTRSLISGERFTVTYKLAGDKNTAEAAARDICAEQTVEFPVQCLPLGAIPETILGRIEHFTRDTDAGESWLARISYAAETAAGEFTQFLNVIFGNISIKRGIQVVAIDPAKTMDSVLKGPRFGVSGLRTMLGVKNRPLVFSAIKPMGLSAKDMAVLAGQFALGGVDLIKDDHGLSNQVFAPFEERVKRCSEAVAEANAKTGTKTLYLPNVSAPHEELLERTLRAVEWGAGGVFLNPGITGIDALRAVCDKAAVPVFAHPAFLGSYAVNPNGISCAVIFGTLMRLAGVDASIFPNYGGRFPLSREECLAIAAACRNELGGRLSIFPCPAGGMELGKINDMIANYGIDTLILIGGGLFSGSGDIISNCHRILDQVNRA
jgi:ribulose-bisphosphate carboxylase large chain